MDASQDNVDSSAHSNGAGETRFKHLHVYIEEEDDAAFGWKITKLLNDLEQARAEIVHISTQVLLDPDPETEGQGLILHTGQVICRIHETQLAFYRERMGSNVTSA